MKLIHLTVLLCLSKVKSHTVSSVNEILSLDILNFSSLDDFPYYLLWKNRGVQSVSDLGERPFNLRGEGYVIFLKKIF
jgi:hypothetical protein